MKEKLFIQYDAKGDCLELRFGKPTPSIFEEKGDDLFERRDEKTGALKGYTFFNVKKRHDPRGIEVDMQSFVK